MLYYLFDYLDQLNFPGAGMFQYVMFRSAMAVVFSLLIGIFAGKRIIDKLQQKQIGETIRNLDLEGQYSKRGTPTMEGDHHPLHIGLHLAFREAGKHLHHPHAGQYCLARYAWLCR